MSKSNTSFENKGGHNRAKREILSDFHDYSDFPYDSIAPKDIKTQTNAALERWNDLVDISASSEELTWDAIAAPIIQANYEACTFYAPIYITSKAHKKGKVRDAATESLVAIDRHDNAVWHRSDLYEKFKQYQDSDEGRSLEGERARYLRLRMQLFTQRGHGLDQESRQRIHEIKDELSELEITFSKNINKGRTKVALGKAALRGLSKDYLSNLERTENGKYLVSTDPEDVYTVLQESPIRKTRQMISAAHGSIATETNSPLLERMVAARQESARLLGYTSFAHSQLEQCIIKNPEDVKNFYNDLVEPLKPKGRAEIRSMKKQLRSDGYDDVLRLYDTMYYSARRQGGIDENEQLEILHHYPLRTVLEGIFGVSEEFFGLKYVLRENAVVWHKDVLTYDVYEDDVLVSTLNLDLFSRNGKDEGTYHLPIRACRELPDGTLIPSKGAILAEFIPSNAKGGFDQMLAFEEIHELWHELGHFTAMVKARAEASEFIVGDEEGLFLGKDYAELAAQVMEKWAEDPRMLRRISGHLVTGKKLSLKRIERNLEKNRTNKVITKLGRLAMHYSDLLIHDGSHGTNFREILRRSAEISMFPYEEDTFILASWSHLTNYPAQTSGYDVSEVAAYDIFENFIKPAGLTNREVGREFEEKFLRPTGTKDPAELIRDLLGRDFNSDAYLRKLGVEPA